MENLELPPLYNNRLIKVKVEYLNKYYPEIDVEEILSYAGIKSYELEERGHWLNQRQTDRFCSKCKDLTGDPDIIRKTGRYMALSSSIGSLKQYTLGLLSPKTAYLLMARLLPMLSRGTEVIARKLGPHTVEIVSKPNLGVDEKLYQCENRAGTFEAISQPFTGSFAEVDHPECFHRGDDCCRYIVSWQHPPSINWKRLSQAAGILGVASVPFLLYYIPLPQAIIYTLLFFSLSLSLSNKYFQKKSIEFAETLKAQGSAAKDHIDEANLRYNNIMLVHEIAKITSDILDAEELIQAVVNAMERRLDFDRGMVMLADEKRGQLYFAAGYGYDERLSKMLNTIEFNLSDPRSKGVFVRSFHRQEPYLIDDIQAIASDLSAKSHDFATATGSKSLVCVPLVYDRRSIGILVVDNVRSKRPLTQSDISILTGIAGHTAANLSNALSFEKLAASEKKYRDLVENANSVILRHDIGGRITFFNDFGRNLFGFDHHEIIGRNILGTILNETPENIKNLRDMMATLRRSPDVRIVRETETTLPGGEKVWIAWTHKPIFNGEGNVAEVLYIGNDITQLKQAQREKKALEARLRRAEKMEALGTMAGGVAHDLNNILSGIVGYPELLLSQLPADSPMRRFIISIQKSGEKAAAVVQDLLAITRRGVIVSEIFSLNETVLEYLSSLEYQQLQDQFPGVRFIKDLDPNIPNISGSRIHLSKTLMNLVTNAAESIEVTGQVIIKTEHSYINQSIRGYDQVAKGEYIILKVSDNGRGIHHQDIERIFEPFYTKKKMGRSGTGLGMALVWGTVKDHRGFIDVSSRINEGTVFTLYFPITNEKAELKPKTAPLEKFKGDGERILVIDDMEDQRDLASQLLSFLGYQIETAASGEEGLELLRKRFFDLILLDMIMESDMDGLETFRRALEINPNQRAIIASGFSENARVREALNLGAGAYLKKPYSLEAIGLAVHKELHKVLS